MENATEVRLQFMTSLSSLLFQAPMKLKPISDQDELYKAFKQASAILKDKYTSFRRTTATVNDGRRHGTLDGYLKPAMGRKNLHVLLRTQAVSVST